VVAEFDLKHVTLKQVKIIKNRSNDIDMQTIHVPVVTNTMPVNQR